ncbi:MAG: hypothetical protein QMD12_03170 [Candidatus Aenigmarchaeota archaeon]|nr:hypothetical protein [Candidatus Aenigmarchaeota archaeon]
MTVKTLRRDFTHDFFSFAAVLDEKGILIHAPVRKRLEISSSCVIATVSPSYRLSKGSKRLKFIEFKL